MTPVLETILTQIERRDDEEDARQETADSKLTSALAVTPIIIALSTTAFFGFIQYAGRFGNFAALFVFLFVLAIISFLGAAASAICGLLPQSAQYSTIGLKTLTSFMGSSDRDELLRRIISERIKCVLLNKAVNGRKLGLYTQSSILSAIGLTLLSIVVIATTVGISLEPKRFLPAPFLASDPTSTPSGTSSRLR